MTTDLREDFQRRAALLDEIGKRLLRRSGTENRDLAERIERVLWQVLKEDGVTADNSQGPGGDAPDPPTYTYATLPPAETLVSRCDAVLSLAEAARALMEAASTCSDRIHLNGMMLNACAIAVVARQLAEREVAAAAPSTGDGR